MPNYDDYIKGLNQKVKVHVGPGLADQVKEIQEKFSNVSSTKEAQDAMKNFMSKTVEELASEDPSGSGVETISVRGDNIVLPAKGMSRHITTLFACLYALENREVDRILHEVGLNSQVVVDGKIVTRRLMPDESPPAGKVIQEGEDKPARSILIGHAEFDPEKDRLVAVRSVDKDGPMWIGTYDKTLPKPEPDKDGVPCHTIRPMFGDVMQSIRETDIVPIRTEAQLAEILSAITTQK